MMMSACCLRHETACWTWWRSAGGRYGRYGKPALGSILVLKRTSRLRYGHLAVVSRVLNSRKILADHANWLNRGQIHQSTPVRDVSPNNNWSAVRVLQKRLTVEGFDVVADGVFGPKTRDALAVYQGRNGLIQDGIAGPSTRASLGM
jgi:murein L,D-transpeptidase YcbB/YkuD